MTAGESVVGLNVQAAQVAQPRVEPVQPAVPVTEAIKQKVEAAPQVPAVKDVVVQTPPDIDALLTVPVAELGPQAAETIMFRLAAATQVDISEKQIRAKGERPSKIHRKLVEKHEESVQQVDLLSESTDPMEKALGIDLKIAMKKSELRSTEARMREHQVRLRRRIVADNPDLDIQTVKRRIEQGLQNDVGFTVLQEEYDSQRLAIAELSRTRNDVQKNGQAIPDQAVLAVREVAAAYQGTKTVSRETMEVIESDPLGYAKKIVSNVANDPGASNELLNELRTRKILTKEQVKDIKKTIDQAPNKTVIQGATFAALIAVALGLAIKKAAEDGLESGGGRR